MRLSVVSYLLLIISICFLIQFELAHIEEGIHLAEDSTDAEAQARGYYELYERIWFIFRYRHLRAMRKL